MSRQTFTLTLAWAKMIAPQIRHLAFRYEGAEPFTFIPGQFITLHIQTGDKELRRSYSIANVPGEHHNQIEFAASYIEKGVASELLFNLKEGETVTATGPFGRLILREEQPARYILIATGTGVTPYRAMLKELAKRLSEQPNLQVVLLFGVRRPEDLLYREEFVALAQQQARFQFRAYYSRAVGEQVYEYQGHVHNAFAEIKPDAATDVVYLCGNPNMIDEAYALLAERGFASQNVRREKYISSH